FFAALRYVLVENSASLRARLEQRFPDRMAAGKVKITARITNHAALGHFILFANEFLDALPVEVVSCNGQLHVGLKNGHFTEIFLPPKPEVLDYLERYSVHPEPGERLEAGLVALDAVAEIAAALRGRHGFCIFIDYGYTREEQLAGRHRGTLKSIRRH